MHGTTHVPELGYDASARTVDSSRNFAPALGLFVAPDARGIRPAEALQTDADRLWNGSTEQARANVFAAPLLHLADRVTVLSVNVPGP